MRRDTLVDFFHDFADRPQHFLVYDDGFRTRLYCYADVGRAARAFASRLKSGGIGKGDRLIFWSENRPEWLVALWGCLLEGVVVVPIDYRASSDFLHRVHSIVQARAVLFGEEVPANALATQPLKPDAALWPMVEIEWPAPGCAVQVSGPDTAHLAAGGAANAESGIPSPVGIGADTVAEIIFTSGATAEPKGVVVTHRNLLANIVPVEREVMKYRTYGRPFFPLRFLNLLPLSHLFGQAMATFVPPMLPGVVVFMRGYNPQEIVRQIRSRRISVLVCVPKILEMLAEYTRRTMPEVDRVAPARQPHVAIRWWRYRSVHRMLGLKFWSFVVGAAPLDSGLEEFWSRLGFLVIQGYGLTETAPIVSLNHPFATRKGSVGKPIAGVEVRIASDGEILVRGDNVTSGYYHAETETAAAFEKNGWFHTGDIGAIDEAGRLFVRGRKKEMIVTPEGLNVFPEDVEHILNAVDGVRESAVVGVTDGGEERVHAVLVLDEGVELDAVVRSANLRLEDHQKVRSASRWPGTELPRTDGTRKLRRGELKAWVERGATPRTSGAVASETVEAVVSRLAHGRTVTRETTLDELGLSSLERVQLMMALEDQFKTTIDEGSFSVSRTVGDLHALVTETRPVLSDSRVRDSAFARVSSPPESEAPSARHMTGGVGPIEPIDFPSWNRSVLARAIRRVSLPTWILPLARVFAWMKVDGRHHLEAIHGPVIFAANHQSHMDAPVILAALPARLRYRVAPAMAKEFFKAHFHPEQHTWREWLSNSLNYYLSSLFFNAFPLPQREAGTRQTLRYIGELVSEGFSVLIFPEGQRTDTGEIRRFLPGVGMIASRLDVPVVPVRLEGLDRVLHRSWRMARPGHVTVVFCAPLRLRGNDYTTLSRQVEDAVRSALP